MPVRNISAALTRIGIISDTHGYLDPKVFEYFNKVDEVWHAGDIGSIEVADKLAGFKPLKAVYGNMDGQDVRIVWPEEQRFRCEETDVWMTHIGGYPGKYSRQVRNEIRISPPGLFVSGHSHILKVMYDKKIGVLHLNPGAAGKSGLHKVRTLLRFAIDGKKFKDMEVIELGTRR